MKLLIRTEQIRRYETKNPSLPMRTFAVPLTEEQRVLIQHALYPKGKTLEIREIWLENEPSDEKEKES